MKETVDVFNEVSKYEHMINKKSFLNRKTSATQKNNNKNEDYHPCRICEKLQKGTRYHPEATCWFKTKEGDVTRKYPIRHVNNSVIETELNETDQKNEYTHH